MAGSAFFGCRQTKCGNQTSSCSTSKTNFVKGPLTPFLDPPFVNLKASKSVDRPFRNSSSFLEVLEAAKLLKGRSG